MPEPSFNPHVLLEACRDRRDVLEGSRQQAVDDRAVVISRPSPDSSPEGA